MGQRERVVHAATERDLNTRLFSVMHVEQKSAILGLALVRVQ
jgi:hypothetical protein